MSYRTEDDNCRKPKEVFPTITETIKNREFWKNKTMTYLGQKHYFDQDVRTGICYFCKKEGRAQKSRTTYLHHVNYYHQDMLEWTIEVCGSCHWHIDEHNRNVIARTTGKEINRRYGKYDSPYQETPQQKITREEREKRDWYMKYCSNPDGKFIPMKEWCPDKETYDKVLEAVKKGKTASKKETMSSVSRRYMP